MKNLIRPALVVSFLATGFLALGETERQSHVTDSGYQFQDADKYIRSTDSDGDIREIVYSNDKVATPCAGKNLPPEKTRDARITNHLECSGGYSIREKRTPEAFDQIPGFKEVSISGDPVALYKFMRDHSKSSWDYSVDYNTSVSWTWTRRWEGRSGSHCGYTYVPAECTKTTEIESRSCHYVPDEDNGSSGGGVSPSFRPPSGGGGGGSRPKPRDDINDEKGRPRYEHTNPFGWNDRSIEKLFEVMVPKAYAGQVCTDWIHSRYEYTKFTCYDRYVRSCPWNETVSDSMSCSSEKLPLHVELMKKPESEWNPDKPNYVPFLPNGNDLLPGESEELQLDVAISNSGVHTSQPNIVSGQKGASKAYYAYDHSIQASPFQCVQGARNTLRWEIKSRDREVTKTPNSLLIATNDKTDGEADFSKTGLFDNALSPILKPGQNGVWIATDTPQILRALDTSTTQLNAIVAAFRQSDHRDDATSSVAGTVVSRGRVSAGKHKQFWKDTFYRVQLLEVFPGSWKRPNRVAEMLIQTDSLVRRTHNLITLPLAGQQSDTQSAYDETSSGVLIPKGYYRSIGEQYIMIPGQTYELRLSMLHRGIPFYSSGCSDGGVSCEREAPNLKAFSDEKAITFVYQGAEKRGMWRRYYDFTRRLPPW